MASYQEPALFSLSAYAESGINRIDPPAGWTLDPDLSRSDSTDRGAAPLLFAQREQRVAGTFIRGEILETIARPVFPTVVADGELDPIEVGDTTLSNPLNLSDATTLHGMLLHAALVTSDELRLASARLPSLLESMVDATLYAQDNVSNIPGFLNALIERELAAETGTGQLDAFAQDLLRLGTSGSAHIQGLQEGLISAAIERYYELPSGSASPFFEQVSGGIKFDVSPLRGVGTDRGLQRLAQSVFALPLSSLEDRLIARARAADAEVWTVQVGNDGLTTGGAASDEVQIGSASASNELNGADGHDLLIGGVSADSLSGGAGNDVLLGGAEIDDLRGGDDQDYLSGGSGDDRLEGGNGRDTLVGGVGQDTYVFTGNFGADTIIDSDGDGVLSLPGDPGALQIGDRVAFLAWESVDHVWLYTLLGFGTDKQRLVIKRIEGSSDSITIEG